MILSEINGRAVYLLFEIAYGQAEVFGVYSSYALAEKVGKAEGLKFTVQERFIDDI